MPNAPQPRSRNLIIYCDESDEKGKYFSHFYGGLAVDARKRDRIEEALRKKRDELNIQGEMKWTKIGSGHEERYKAMMDALFSYISAKEIKGRVMFLQNLYSATDLEDYHYENQYFILYYHFIKHAFGLQFCNPNAPCATSIHVLLDQLPEAPEKCKSFKEYLISLNAFPLFRENKIVFSHKNIVEIESKHHVIAQCLDVVLGAIQFRLNDKHLEKPPGARRRGKRTLAKERVYKHIRNLICSVYPNFNIGVSTARPEPKSTWTHKYRHWRFIPANAKVHPGRSKQR